MSQANSKTAAPPATKAATSHEPSRELQPSVEQAEATPESFIHRAAGGITGGGDASPFTPPGSFISVLGQMQGSSLMRLGLLRQLQRKYGNSYVGQVIQRQVESSRAANANPPEEGAKIQARAEGESSSPSSAPPASVLQAGGGGRTLDSSTRSFMESRFGADFTDVKVHTDHDAAQAARQIHAQAFTFGRDIYFGAGRYQPEASEGRKLLAHELTHVVQQSEAPAPSSMTRLAMSEPGDAGEREAEAIAHQVTEDDGARPVGPTLSTPPVARRTLKRALIQRQGDDKKTEDDKKTDAGSADKTPAPEPAKTAVSEKHTDNLTKLREILDRAAKSKPDHHDLANVTYIWRLFGDDVVNVAMENMDLWERSVKLVEAIGYVGHLYEMSGFDSVREQFKKDVKAVALGHLSKNQKLAQAELARYSLKEGMAPPTLPPAFANIPGMPGQLPDRQLRRLQRLQVMAQHAVALQEMLDGMKKIQVGLLAEHFNPARPPIGDFRIGEMTSWEMIKLEWDNVSDMLSQILNTNPTIYVAMNLGKEYIKSIVETDPKKDRFMALHTIRVLMSAILNNIRSARDNITSDRADHRDFKPIHAQLYAGMGNKLWSQPLYKAIAKHEVKDHEDTEYWKKLGLEAAGLIALVVVEMASLGSATFFITLALGAAKVYMAEESYGAIAAAGSAQVTGGTDIVYKEQVQAARIEAESQRINLVASMVLLGAGKMVGPALNKALAPVSTFGAPVEAATATLGGRLRMSILSSIVTGPPSGMLGAAAASLPQVMRGEMSADAFLQKVGWAAFTGTLTAAITSGLTAAGQHAMQGGFAKPSPDTTVPPRSVQGGAAEPAPKTAAQEPPARVDFDKLPPAGGSPPPRGSALPGEGQAPQLPGGSDWVSTPAGLHTETGETVQVFMHLPTKQVFTIRFNFRTGNGSITGMGQTVPISGSVLRRPAIGLLPPAGETPAGQGPTATPEAPQLPGAPTYPRLPGGPTYPRLPGAPTYPRLPGAPTSPTPPGAPTYPRLPGPLQYPLLPAAPGAQPSPARAPGEPLVTPPPPEYPLLPPGPVKPGMPPPEDVVILEPPEDFIEPDEAFDPSAVPPETTWEDLPPPAVTAEQQAIIDAKSEQDYLTALRNDPQGSGRVGRSWDYGRFPKAPKGRAGRWKPGDPTDMPDAKGNYPSYDTARGRYWKNRAYYELQARAAGRFKQDANAWDDPIRVLSDAELQGLLQTGNAPLHPLSKRPMELEHVRVPQRVEGYLEELGFSPSDARKLARVASPESLLEVDPFQHASLDTEAAGFGTRTSADTSGRQWKSATVWDERIQDPLSRMDDATLLEITQRAVNNNYNFNKNDKTRILRDALLNELYKRDLPYPMPTNQPPPPVQPSYRDGYAGEVRPSDGEELSKQLQSASANGRRLDAGLRHQLESGLGADLSNVRVHTDDQAARLTEAVNATAFTTGQDIYFGAGAYRPDTQSGLRLLAHEAAHTIQQSQGPVEGTPAPGGLKISDPSDSYEQAASVAADRVVAGGSLGLASIQESGPGAATDTASIQRFKGAGGAAPTGEPEDASTNRDIGPTILYQNYVLSTDSVQMYEVLAAEARQYGLANAEAFARSFYIDWYNDHPGKVTPAEDELARKISDVLINQVEPLKGYRNQLLQMYESSARTFTVALLDESVQIIKQEVEHYGLKVAGGNSLDACVVDGGPEESVVGASGFEKRLGNMDEGARLVEAAKELYPLKAELERLEKEIVATYPPNTRGSLPASKEQLAERARLSEIQAEVNRKYRLKRAEKEAEFPILAAYSENLSGLKTIKSGTFSAAREIGPLIVDKLNNIKKVRAGLDKVIWKQETIYKGTKAQMGIAEKSLDARLLDDYSSSVKWSETLMNLALGAISIGLGLIAAIPTGGASLAASIAATGAAIGGAALTTYQAFAAYEQYQLESAAAGSAFDKAKAISQDDPSLFWLALDVVAAIVDIRGALHAYKALSQAVRAAIASRALLKEGEAVARAAGIGAKELEAIKALAGNNTKLYESILAHIVEAADAGKVPVKELEEAARAQYKALKESGRLGEIKDISEELFVKQMTYGARQHIIISGAEGVKRTKIITSLLDPANPFLTQIIKGNPAAMDALLIQHGNWKQLISMLDQGTPEMREAAKALVARRAVIDAEVETMFKAKLSGSLSEERISDIDRATQELDAGRDMIRAEEYVASKYGKGWSEALRMNFYTDAARLSQYEKVMGGLSAAQRGALLERITEQTEIYNIAKMMEHAHGDEQLLKEVKAYAERLKINLDDPRIAEVLPKLSGKMQVAERNKLLLEIDDLMHRYVHAQPGSEEQLKLAEEITSKQMRANLFTEEAYIGPGAVRSLVGRQMVVGHEAYQFAFSNVEMIYHILASNGGDVVLTMRQYEVYKYMSRFAEAAEMAGVKHPMLQNWKAISKTVYKTERQGFEEISHLRPKEPGSIIDADITGVEAQQLYDSWRSFSQKVLDDMKQIAKDKPHDWTPPKEAVEASL